MVAAVIFDVGGVLVESPFVAALRWQQQMELPNETLRVFFEEYAKVPEPGEEPPAWHRVEMGTLSVQSFLDDVRPKIRGLVPDDHVVFSVSAADFNVFENAGAHWEMIHAVRRCRERGLATAILTNNVKEWGAWRDVVSLADFDVVVDSCEVGMRKPDPAIWQHTLDRLGVAPEQAAFLDDHPANVAAADQMGMTGIVVTADIAAAVAEVDGLGFGGEAST